MESHRPRFDFGSSPFERAAFKPAFFASAGESSSGLTTAVIARCGSRTFFATRCTSAAVTARIPGATIRSEDRFALEVLATILSGQGGRLFVELRDKKGLAYRVSAFSLEGVDPGYFAVYIATSPQNLDVAMAGIKDELAKIIAVPVEPAELERAQRYLVGAHEISLQRRAALASTLAFHEAYGLGWDEYRHYAPAILAVTAADVQRVAKKVLDPERAITAVVKPEELSPALAKKAGMRAARSNGGEPKSKRGR